MDPSVVRLPGGSFKMFFKDLRRVAKGTTASATSTDGCVQGSREDTQGGGAGFGRVKQGFGPSRKGRRS